MKIKEAVNEIKEITEIKFGIVLNRVQILPEENIVIFNTNSRATSVKLFDFFSGSKLLKNDYRGKVSYSVYCDFNNINIK